MEALGYVFVYFLQKGHLPWQGLKITRSEKRKTILQKKQSTSPEELCKGLPDEFVKYFDHVKTARSNNDSVNYNYLLRLFRSLFRRLGFEHDNVYDWTVLKYMEQLEQQQTRTETK